MTAPIDFDTWKARLQKRAVQRMIAEFGSDRQVAAAPMRFKAEILAELASRGALPDPPAGKEV